MKVAELTDNVHSFEGMDGKKVSLFFNDLIPAIESDMTAQGRTFRVTPFGKQIHSAFQLGNAKALARGKAIGIKLKETGQLGPGMGYINGLDLAKIITYILFNEGGYSWPSVREAVENFGDPLTRLLTISRKENLLGTTVHKAIQLVRTEKSSFAVASELRKLADIIEPISAQNVQLIQELETSKLTIVNTTTRNTRLNNALKRYQEAIDRLAEALKGDLSIDQRIEMQNQLSEFNERIKQIME